jgi:carboxypeptidase Q
MKRTRKSEMEHVDAMRVGSMRSAFALFCSLLLPGNVVVSAQQASPADVSPGTRDAIRQMAGDTIVIGRAYAYDNYLADNIGPRLTGSENYMRAAEWAVHEFQSLGLSEVHTEEWTMPAAWEPGTAATGRILAPIGHQLHIYSMGWSPSTPPGGVEGEVFYVPSMEIAGLDRQKPQLTGAIALIDDASFSAAQSIDKMFPALEHLRSLGIRAILVAGGSNGTEVMDTRNISGTIDPLPEAQIGMEDVLLIKRLLGQGSVKVHFSFANHVRQRVRVANVVAEIKAANRRTRL